MIKEDDYLGTVDKQPYSSYKMILLFFHMKQQQKVDDRITHCQLLVILSSPRDTYGFRQGKSCQFCHITMWVLVQHTLVILITIN